MDYINSKTLEIASHRHVCAAVGASIPLGQSLGDWFPILPSDPPAANHGQIVQASAPVEIDGHWYMGWTVRDKTPAELDGQRHQLRERIAARRYETEVGGIEIAGMHVATDDRSKLLINGAAVEAMLDADYLLKWKTTEGFVELTGAQVIGIARAVRAHVQACFDREAELLAALEAGTLTDEMLGQGWP